MALPIVVGPIVLAVLMLAGCATRFIFKQNDCCVEQVIEQIIEHETGIRIDFSPDGPYEPADPPAPCPCDHPAPEPK